MDLLTFGLILFIGGLIGWAFSPVRPVPEFRLDDLFPLMTLVGLVILLWPLVKALFQGEM